MTPNDDTNGNTRRSVTDLRIEFARMQAEFQGITARELKRLADEVEKLRTAQQDIRIDLARLRTEFNIRAGVWGLVGSMIPAALAIGYILIKGN